MTKTACAVVVLAIGAAACTAAVPAPDTGTMPVSAMLASRAEPLLLARCAVCHSADLITEQRLPRSRWEATVEKMIGWGAELSKDEAELLVRYLSARYHPDAPSRLPPVEGDSRRMEQSVQGSISVGPLSGVAGRGAGLFAQHCQACHGPDAAGGMGPKLAKSSMLEQEELFQRTVLQGRDPMPAWGAVLSRQDVADIHAWLLTR